MITSLMDLFTDTYTNIGAQSDLDGYEVTKAFTDTFATIQAGWGESVTQNIRQAYPSVASPFSEEIGDADPEAMALVWGTAAHALDYDDVHTTSVTHPSAVIVPAIESIVLSENLSRDRVYRAYLLGLAINIAVGDALGFDHYIKGWHATSTIGPLSSVAAVSYLMDLDEHNFRSAISLAAAQAGGMQRNFGKMAKPVQAGLAASAGVRAARLAANGINAASDAFGEKGFIDLYSGSTPGKKPSEIIMVLDASTLSRKLYPCCYLAHRPIIAALKARKEIDLDVLTDPSVTVDVRVPFGGTRPLRVLVPNTGLEGKFSGPYTVAVALTDGQVNLRAFEDESVRRFDLQDLSRRITLVEDDLNGSLPEGINHGTVSLFIKRGSKILSLSEIEHFPGSPQQPITNLELETKTKDCVDHALRIDGVSINADELLKQAANCVPMN
ncbi:MAG TPA: MmgE/PrpD family protein [Rhodospirillaceae bacterium]|nr:MmgE/PrpD family protein [Candidatus Neomarinimicrobiota bacterium]HCX14232.1 MmgE/PrpD family protein [Rhodospirillaceae bacterium]